MVKTLANVAPLTGHVDEKKSLCMQFWKPRDSSRPAGRINGNASLKMHCIENSAEPHRNRKARKTLQRKRTLKGVECSLLVRPNI